MPNSKCTLCGRDAKYKHAPFGTSNKCFSCPECLLFVISPEAEKLLESSPANFRQDLSKKSKSAKVGDILLIFTERSEKDKTTINSKFDQEKKWY